MLCLLGRLHAAVHSTTVLTCCHRPRGLLLLLLKTVLKEKGERRRKGGRRGTLASETSALLHMRIVSSYTPLQTRSSACVPPSVLIDVSFRCIPLDPSLLECGSWMVWHWMSLKSSKTWSRRCLHVPSTSHPSELHDPLHTTCSSKPSLHV